MATWIGNFLAKLHLDRSVESFILNVLYDESLSEDEKSANIFDFLESNVKAANVNLQDAVSDLFAQYHRNALYMMVAPEYDPRPQPVQQRPVSALRPPIKEFVPSSLAKSSENQQEQEDASEDDAEIHGIDPTKRGDASPQESGAWARIDDDDDGVGNNNAHSGPQDGHDNDRDVFRVPTSQIYGADEDGYGENGDDGYGDEYYDEEGAAATGGHETYGHPWEQSYQQQAWGSDPYDNDEFDPFAPPNMADMQVLQSVQGYSPYVGYGQQQFSPQIPSHAGGAMYQQGYYNPYDPATGRMFNPYEQQQLEQQQGEATATQDMTPLEMLQRILSDMKPEQIEQAFEDNGHDMDAALSAIITKRKQATVKDPLQQFIPKGDPRATQTCRFFLQGKCLRKDCWYSHDLSSMVCRFWLKGECLKGETCEFSHGLDADKLAEVVEAEPVVKKQAPPSMDEWDFPSLSSSAKPASSKKGGTKNGSSGGSSSKPATQNSTVDSLAEDLNSKTNISNKPVTTPAKPPALSYSATAAKAASKPLTPLRSSTSLGGTASSQNVQPKFNLAMAPSSIPWLETGSALNKHYLQARAQAADFAAARNRCFEMARQAYLRNDGAAASRYSAEGRQYNERMMETHREASQKIFATRNALTTKKKGANDERNETWIDLHGLHVEEALVFLDQFMEKLENEVYTGVVYVVTGTGHHSTLGLAKVRRAVLTWLKDWGYLHEEISVDGVHGGLVAVQVIKGKPC
ncbi:hypothetical protein BGW41_003910 [Actinomortierella wolfii]|nr:hypothetical protein BGW41_003910 [Actinomortierella wolfii]